MMKPTPFAWATFDGEGSYDLRLYEYNEDYREEWIARHGQNYADWVIPLYTAQEATQKKKTMDGNYDAEPWILQQEPSELIITTETRIANNIVPICSIRTFPGIMGVLQRRAANKIVREANGSTLPPPLDNMAALEMLLELEWAVYDKATGTRSCPYCYSPEKHQDNCKLKRVIDRY